ncbi:MAG: hypothetical protein HEP71_02020 [Roseivirga sp.]|nr:hypothetical protein [Roseivirga sp.]
MKRICWALALMLTTIGMHAQITATTGDGRVVILLEDGTWKFDTTAVVSKKAPKLKKKRKKGNSGPNNPALAAIKCADISVNKTDTQTGEEITTLANSIEIMEGGRKKLTIGLSANKGGTLIWRISLIGEQGCKNRTPEVRITFTDGSKMKLYVANDFVCDNNITLYLGKKLGKKDEVLKLQNKTISSVTVVNQDQTEVLTELSAEQGNVLQKAFICLTGK